METPEITIDWKEVKNIQLSGIDIRDYPDFVDAFVEAAIYKGKDATEEELEAMSNDREVIDKLVFERLF